VYWSKREVTFRLEYEVLEQRTYGLVYEFVGAWNRHDADWLAMLYADDALYEDLRLAVTLRGREAILGHLRLMFAAGDDAVLALGAEPVAGDDRAYFEWMMATSCGGQTPQLRGVSVMFIEDGRIVRQTNYAHPAAPDAAFETTSVSAAAVAEDNIAWGE
jgi:ketosteroid isomerase-like protein